MRTAITNIVAIVFLWLCCCDPARGVVEPGHDHVRTKSAWMRKPRTDALTAGMPVTTAIAVASNDDATATGGGGGGAVGGGAVGGGAVTGGAVTGGAVGGFSREATGAGNNADTGALRNLLVHQPSKIFRKLMLTGVDVVQRSMDTYQSATSKMYDVARTTIGRPRTPIAGPNTPALQPTATSPNVDKPADGIAPSDRGPAAADAGGRSSQRSLKTTGDQPKTVNLGNSVIDLLDTGIGGMEQMTDLGLLLGNIGTHKIRARLDGQSGNRAILKLLIKYVGSRAGMATRGSPAQMIDDIGTISTFVANDDEVTTMISVLMERFMGDTDVSKAIVRVVITMLEQNPSTECVLDKLPLAPADLRMLFDVFVGSNGQAMMKTIAGLLSDLTTGPDTKAFLESALGMVSMFKSSSTSTTSKKQEKPTSVLGSLTNLFTGGDINVDDTKIGETKNEPISPPPVQEVIIKRPPLKRLSKTKEDPWFNDGSNDDKTDPKKTIQSMEDLKGFSQDSDRSLVPKPADGSKINPKPAPVLKKPALILNKPVPLLKKPVPELKKPGKINEKFGESDKENLIIKKSVIPIDSKPRNTNLVDNASDSYEDRMKIKKINTTPSKTKTAGQGGSINNTKDNFGSKDEKNVKLPNKKENLITKKNVIPINSKPISTNLVDDASDSYEDRMKIKKIYTTPSKTKTNGQSDSINSTNDNFGSKDEKNVKLSTNKENLIIKKNIKFVDSKPSNTNLVNDAGDSYEDRMKIKKLTTTPSKTKTDGQSGTKDNFWSNNEKNVILSTKKGKTKETGAIAQN